MEQTMNMESFIIHDLVDYNEDKISQKIIFQNEATKIIAFALKKGQVIPEHIAKTDVFLQVIEGKLIFYMEDEKIQLKKGMGFKIPALVPHSLEAVTDFKMLLCKSRMGL